MRQSTGCRLVLASLLLTQIAAPSPTHAGWPPLFRSAQLYGTGSWSTSSTMRTGNPYSVAAGDVNGDGISDLVVADNEGVLAGTNTISVLLHSGDSDLASMFRPKVNYPCGAGPRSIALADLNLDGKLDVVVANYQTLSVLLGTGAGTFGAPTTYATQPAPGHRIAVADVNGDTWPDVVIPFNGDPPGIGILLGTGNGGLGACTLSTYANPAYGYESVVVADVTNDLIVDIVAVGEGHDPMILAGNNTGAFSFLTFLTTSSPGSWDVVVGHFNADAFPDIAVGVAIYGPPGSGVDVLIGSGTGTWQAYVHHNVIIDAFSLALGDVTGDGTADIVAGMITTEDGRNSVAVLPNLGNGTFGPPAYHSITAQTGPVVLADLNMNGRLDVIAPTKTLDSSYAKTHTVGVLLDDGAGAFLDGVWSFDTRRLNRGAVADFNRDGMGDVACSDSASIRVGLGTGSGAFTDIGGPSTSVNPGTVVAADLNRDGKADILFQNGTSVTRHLGAGDGTFGAAGTITTLMIFFPRSVVDLTQDGLPDVIGRATVSTNTLRTMIQQSDGTFLSNSQIISSQIRSVAHGDWNRDGKTDVVAALGNGVSFWPGTGTGSGVGTEMSITAGRPFMDVCAGDFNRDGKLDVAALDSLAGQSGVRGFDVFLGNGTGGFAAPISTPTLEQIGCRIESWDANVDGIPDLILSEITDHDPFFPEQSRVASLEVFLGDGSGRFGLQSAYGLGSTPIPASATGMNAPHFAAGDVNGDDLPDILAASTTLVPNQFRRNLQALLSIAPNQGNGLGPKTDYAMSTSTSRVALGDLNRDGFLDVVSGSSVDPGVTVRLGVGGGVFGSGSPVGQSLTARQVGLGDFNRDGILDLITSRADLGPPEAVSIMLGVGDGTFGARTDFLILGIVDFAIADMNRDGKLDLVIGQPTMGLVRVMTGNGDGTFTTQAGGTIPWIYDLDTIDVDRDGILDVVAAGGGLYTLHGNGDGTLGNSVAFSLGGETTLSAVCVADFDRDGYQDIAASNQSGKVVVAWGSTSFTTYVKSTFPASGWDLQAGTAEADGRTFLFMSAFGNQVLVLAPGVTPGSFTLAGSYPVGTDPEAIALGDLNRDGLIDAVTANSGTGNLSVLLHATNVVTGVAVVPAAMPPARLDQNAPNPFNPTTTVHYAVAASDRVRLGVYDVRGRLVATLVDGFVPAGEHKAPWDGRTDQGTSAASGVYFYQLRTASGYEQSRQMVMLK